MSLKISLKFFGSLEKPLVFLGNQKFTKANFLVHQKSQSDFFVRLEKPCFSKSFGFDEIMLEKRGGVR